MGKGLVLLIEDQLEIREVTRELLGSYGYRVIEASTGTEGIRLSKENEVRAVIIDLGLPDMNGRDVAALLRHLPIIILTGNAGEMHIPEADIVLQKPLRRGQLQDALSKLLQ